MRTLLYFLLLIIPANFLFAQKTIGIKLSPGLTVTNLKQEDNLYSSDIRNMNWGNNANPGFSGGLFVDFPLVKNRLALSTGILYSMRNFKLDIKTPIQPMIYNSETQAVTYFLVKEDPQYLLHQLQLPVTLKVFTNSTPKENRFYFQAGTLFNLKIAEQPVNKDENYLYQLSEQANGGEAIFKSFDISIYGAVGYEWKLKNDHKAFGALSIDKGLLKQINSIEWYPELGPLDYYLNVKFIQLALEFGYMF